jgi:hypothetical protein
VKILEHNGKGAQGYSFKVFKNPKFDITDKVKINLVL